MAAAATAFGGARVPSRRSSFSLAATAGGSSEFAVLSILASSGRCCRDEGSVDAADPDAIPPVDPGGGLGPAPAKAGGGGGLGLASTKEAHWKAPSPSSRTLYASRPRLLPRRCLPGPTLTPLIRVQKQNLFELAEEGDRGDIFLGAWRNWRAGMKNQTSQAWVNLRRWMRITREIAWMNWRRARSTQRACAWMNWTITMRMQKAETWMN